MTLSVRLASDHDAPAIAANEAIASHTRWNATQVAETLRLGHGFGIIAETAGSCVGHLIGTSLFEDGELLTIAVSPSHRRRGIASRIMAAAEVYWREQAAERLFLEVRRSNLAAQRLYEAEGWTSNAVRRRYYSDGEDALIYTKVLGSRSITEP